MYIEVQFSMRDCNLFPGMALSCKETFSLLHYEVEGDAKDNPPWEPESYKLIDRIAADQGRFTSTNEVIINTEVSYVICSEDYKCCLRELEVNSSPVPRFEVRLVTRETWPLV